MTGRSRIASAIVAITIGAGWTTVALSGDQTATSATASASGWAAPRTPWGDPDLQGIWTNLEEDIVPLQRPKQFGERRFMTDAEYELRLKENERRSSWFQVGFEVPKRPSRQTSKIIDPPDGRFPPMTAEGERRAIEMAIARLRLAGPEDFDNLFRCLTLGGVLSMLPSGTNMFYQIVQSRDHIVLVYEAGDVRIIPIDRRPHIGADIRLWMGDSRAHWEGDMLVVDTRNFRDASADEHTFGVVSDALHIVERFTRISQEAIDWQATISDPKIYTKPVTLAVPLRNENVPDRIHEFACHEGNHALAGALSGTRARERMAAEEAKETNAR